MPRFACPIARGHGVGEPGIVYLGATGDLAEIQDTQQLVSRGQAPVVVATKP